MTRNLTIISSIKWLRETYITPVNQIVHPRNPPLWPRTCPLLFRDTWCDWYVTLEALCKFCKRYLKKVEVQNFAKLIWFLHLHFLYVTQPIKELSHIMSTSTLNICKLHFAAYWGWHTSNSNVNTLKSWLCKINWNLGKVLYT